MKASQLKTIVLLLWGTILAVCVLLGAFMFNDPALWSAASQPTPALLASPTLSPGISMNPPTPHKTPSPGIFYLPSATARAATDIPLTPTRTAGSLPPMVQYALTLPANASPLTGLIPDDPQILNRRPVAVKISSFPRGMVRPVQSGLTRADLVYEYYIEDGLTRFIAIFYSKDAGRAGPVRSGRYFDEYIIRMYHAALVFVNADKRVENHLLNSDLLSLLFLPRDDNFPPLLDSGSANAETRVFVNTAGVGAKLSDNSRQNVRAALFGSLLYPLVLPTIERVYTHYSIYSYNYWQYDPQRQIYKRFSDTKDAAALFAGEAYGPHIDNLNGEQLSADNVVVLVIPHIFHNEFDRADQVIDIALNGTGPAYVFRNGRMATATWVRMENDQPFQLFDERGFALPMQQGVTYYQVINPESTIRQNGNTIEFFFSIPLLKVTATPTPPGFNPSPTPKPTRKHKD